MDCPICHAARACLACVHGGNVRRRAEAEPEFAALVAALWAGAPAPPSPPRDFLAPLILARACDYSGGRPDSCSCAGKAVCRAGFGRGPDMTVHLSECVACPHGGPLVD